MKAEELFKTKAEVAQGLDKLGVVYPKIKSGANEGKPTETFAELCKRYDDAKVVKVDPIINTPRKSLLKKAFGFR
jgi:hypothetical protein